MRSEPVLAKYQHVRSAIYVYIRLSFHSLSGGETRVQRRTLKKNVICPEWGELTNDK